MTGSDARMRAVLHGYAKFLRGKDLALPKHEPYLVRWVREFFVFARERGGYTFEQTLDMGLPEIGFDPARKPTPFESIIAEPPT